MVGIDGDSQEKVIYHNVLNELRVADLLILARAALHNTHREPKFALNGKFKGWKRLFDDDHKKSKDAFINDLKDLASVGQSIWTALFFDAGGKTLLQLQKSLQNGRAILQMGHADGEKKEPVFYYPWSLVYDIALTDNNSDQWETCKVLDNWEPGTHFEIGENGECPHGPHRENIICPYGFWGFKHIIELPVSRRDRPLQKKISLSKDGKSEIIASYHDFSKIHHGKSTTKTLPTN